MTESQNFQPYPYQVEPLGALVSGARKHHIWVFNRRAGKDKTALNGCYQCMEKRVGNYVHVFPTLVEGRRDLWENIDVDGFRTIQHIPEGRIKRKNESTMLIELVNGSTYQVLGADRPDAIRGSNPVGVIWSEFPLMKPTVRFITDPILRRNGGWEVYCFTPMANHAKRLFETNRDNPDWAVFYLTNDETKTFTPEDIEGMRRSGIPEEWIQREVYCSWVSAEVGAYYGREFEQIEAAGRISPLPWNPSLPVDTAWDIGIGLDDATAVWFIQVNGPWFDVIKYIETHGDGLPEWARILADMPYVYGKHYAPHDMYHHEWGLGRKAGTRADVAKGLGIEFSRAPGPKRFGKGNYVAEGIEAVRRLLPRMRFDKEGCMDGIEALKNYRREADEKRAKDEQQPFFKPIPLHNWASHAADAMRYYSISTPHIPQEKPGEGDQAGDDFFTKLQRKGGGSSAGGWMG